MLRDVLASKSWFGFDLDDTLHEFRKASGSASRAVFTTIASQYGIREELLQIDYTKILRVTTKSAFTDGRSSIEYRKERFAALLDGQDLEHDEPYLDYLAEQYKSALSSSLQLKPGALELLRHLKQNGKKVIIVTEGPTDAQVWTVQQLGLEPYVDVLVTTNEVGKAKTDGLFAEVLRIHKILPNDIVYIGDSETRDITPAIQADILAIHYDERNKCRLDAAKLHDSNTNEAGDTNFPRVDKLARIEQLLNMS